MKDNSRKESYFNVWNPIYLTVFHYVLSLF